MVNSYIIEASTAANGYIIAIVAATVFSLLCGFVCLAIAKNKGRGAGWFWFGFFFDIVGIIVCLCVSDVSNRPQIAEEKRKANTFWQCPKCGKTNNLNDKFCPGCGEEYNESYLINDEKWICGHCGAKNDSTSKFCSKCGTDKEIADQELSEKKASQDYLEENGVECEMCGRKVAKLINVRIEDDLGIRYRKVCDRCYSKYNCTIVEEKKTR